MNIHNKSSPFPTALYKIELFTRFALLSTPYLIITTTTTTTCPPRNLKQNVRRNWPLTPSSVGQKLPPNHPKVARLIVVSALRQSNPRLSIPAIGRAWILIPVVPSLVRSFYRLFVNIVKTRAILPNIVLSPPRKNNVAIVRALPLWVHWRLLCRTFLNAKRERARHRWLSPLHRTRLVIAHGYKSRWTSLNQ